MHTVEEARFSWSILLLPDWILRPELHLSGEVVLLFGDPILADGSRHLQVAVAVYVCSPGQHTLTANRSIGQILVWI